MRNVNARDDKSKKVPVASVGVVLLATLTEMLGFGIMLPTLPFYARSLGASPELVSVCMSAFTGGLFISTPVWGRLSDHFGRKPIICLGLAGSLVSYLVLGASENIWTVLVVRFVGGIMAGNTAACSAYIADVTSESDRAKYMGLNGAIFGFGFVAGPLLGSMVSRGNYGESGFEQPALIAAGLTCFSLGAIWFLLPGQQTVSTKRRTSFAGRNAFTLSGSRRATSPILAVAACLALYNLSSGLYETILPLWAADFGLISGPADMWMLITPAGIGFVLSQTFLIGPLVKRFGERTLILYCTAPLFSLTCLMTIAGSLASLAGAIAVSSVLASLAALIIASSQILASKLASPSNTGEVLGVISSAGTLCRTIGMISSGILYNQLHPHAPYWVAAAATALIALFAFRIPRLSA